MFLKVLKTLINVFKNFKWIDHSSMVREVLLVKLLYHIFQSIMFGKYIKYKKISPTMWYWSIPHVSRNMWNCSIPHGWQIFTYLSFVNSGKCDLTPMFWQIFHNFCYTCPIFKIFAFLKTFDSWWFDRIFTRSCNSCILPNMWNWTIPHVWQYCQCTYLS